MAYNVDTFMCLYILSSVLSCPLRFPHENDVRFVFTSSCLYESACLLYVICVCLRIVVSNTYCVVFLFCMLPVSLDCPFLIARSVFSNVYLDHFTIQLHSYEDWADS